ncbi:hypothetical protein [Lachnoclostridium sp.]|uniref:hypothetical protein n=1 Tax=Lachnoclostridium sp. TaxID=2028282 RepID=UPI0026D0AAE5|nr:hypothetical protein [Lachnoclostridium sp.]
MAEDIAIITDGEIRELISEKPYSFAYNGATKEARKNALTQSCYRDLRQQVILMISKFKIGLMELKFYVEITVDIDM